MNNNPKFFSPYFLVGVFICFAGLCSPVSAGQLSLGTEFVGWNSDYAVPFNGWELWAPLSVNFEVDKGFSVYGQTEFGNGSYTDSIQVTQTETTNLTNFSDTVVGSEFTFKSFGTDSLLNIGVNIPTGDPTWEAKQINANPPTEFIDSRYRGRGFGISALYGLSFPSGSGEFGAAAGYMYAGAFNPSYGSLSNSQLKLGDSVFLSLNHVQSYSDGENEIIRLSSFYFLPTQTGGVNSYQLGTNFNASYSWVNPKALSFEVGAQYWMAGQVPDANGDLVAEPHAYYGPRFYLNPSYSFGDFALAARFKYILSNGYPTPTFSTPNPFYDGGGVLGGVEPSYSLKLDGSSDLKFTASFDDIIIFNVFGDDKNYDANANWTMWTFGTSYEVKL